MGEICLEDSIDDAPVQIRFDAVERDRKRLADHAVRAVTPDEEAGRHDLFLPCGMVRDIHGDRVRNRRIGLLVKVVGRRRAGPLDEDVVTNEVSGMDRLVPRARAAV